MLQSYKKKIDKSPWIMSWRLIKGYVDNHQVFKF